jgi:hypothetical protein
MSLGLRGSLGFRRHVGRVEGTGAQAGLNKVSISTYEEPVSMDDGTQKGGKPEKVPAKYNKQSTLTKQVQSGKQTIDFALESK